MYNVSFRTQEKPEVNVREKKRGENGEKKKVWINTASDKHKSTASGVLCVFFFCPGLGFSQQVLILIRPLLSLLSHLALTLSGLGETRLISLPCRRRRDLHAAVCFAFFSAESEEKAADGERLQQVRGDPLQMKWNFFLTAERRNSSPRSSAPTCSVQYWKKIRNSPTNCLFIL